MNTVIKIFVNYFYKLITNFTTFIFDNFSGGKILI